MAGTNPPDAGDVLELCGNMVASAGYTKRAVTAPIPSIVSENDPRAYVVSVACVLMSPWLSLDN
jgi:hypothetical protein